MKAKQHTFTVLLVFVLAAGAALALLTHANRKAEQAASEAEDSGLAALFHTLDPDGHAFTSQFRSQTKQEGEGIAPSPSVHNTNVPPILRKLALLDDFLALVVTAVATCLVGELQRAAVAALDQCGGLQLPNIAATLVAAGLGKMSLRYCHIFAPP
mgnify:FL=1